MYVQGRKISRTIFCVASVLFVTRIYQQDNNAAIVQAFVVPSPPRSQTKLFMVKKKKDRKSRLDSFIKGFPFTREAQPDSESEVVATAEEEASDVTSTAKAPDATDAEAVDATDAEAVASVPPPAKEEAVSKLSRLKDRMWVREALEDLTAAEFACTLGSPRSSEKGAEKEKKKNKKESVDFENLLIKLDKRMEDMCFKTKYGEAGLNAICYPLNHDIASDVPQKDDDECWVYRSNMGMGRATYTDEQRDALVAPMEVLQSRFVELLLYCNPTNLSRRIFESRLRLMKTMSGKVEGKDQSAVAGDLDEFREQLQSDELKDGQLSSGKKENDSKQIGDPSLYIRDDGTIDWDGALQDRAALQKFGISVWARINGQDPEKVDEQSVQAKGGAGEAYGEKAPVTVKIIETEAIKEKKMKLDELQAELKAMDAAHTALLNSAVSAGSAVANVNLATLKPELRTKIRSSADKLDKKKDEVSFQVLNYELERIYTYFDGELGNTSTKGYIPLQDRLNVAEFGLLESQIESLNKQIAAGESVDSDVLAVVLDQTVDLKRRLGIDFYVTGLTFDQEAIKIWLQDLLSKTKKGLAFYGKGCQLFWNDIVFSFSLISRALQGYTLKPREVRTLRRTFKDIITFIPVIIILIIPLSPVGHVFVFGAIQRFFPDFFPSCFTERRQNLLALYESTEFSEFTIDEGWKDKLARLSAATAYVLADNARKLYLKIINVDESGLDKNDQSGSK